MWTPWSRSWQSWAVGQVWPTLLCIFSGRIPSCGAGYHQWDHFCIHPKLLIRGSWIFKYLSSLICLTISILSLGLFCGFFSRLILRFFSSAHLFSDSRFIVWCDQFWDDPSYSRFFKRLGLLSALAASFPLLFLIPKMSGWWNSLQSATLGTCFCIL